MICESCKILVKNALEELEISSDKVELGEIVTKEDLSVNEKKKINLKIKRAGMELLEKKQDVLIEKIKIFMIDYIYNSDEKSTVKFSVLLSKKLGHSYTYLSNYFSEAENTTIEQYIIALKIDKIKELIIFGESSFSEIAFLLNYSSVGHFSAQFKKLTGMTPTHFKKLEEKSRIIIPNI